MEFQNVGDSMILRLICTHNLIISVSYTQAYVYITQNRSLLFWLLKDMLGQLIFFIYQSPLVW